MIERLGVPDCLASGRAKAGSVPRWPAGAAAALGIGAGCLVHAAAAALGLSAILGTSAEAFTVVKLIDRALAQ